MKKLLAIALTVAMLLTCFIAMPVSASTETPVNLIVNGDFEADTAGEDSVLPGAANVTTITGWTQMLETNKVILAQRAGGTNWVKAYNDIMGGFTQNPNQLPEGVTVSGYDLPDGVGLTQTVTIDTNAEWYTNYENYTYNLTYDAHKEGSVWRGRVIATVTGADGTAITKDITPDDIGTPNAYNSGVSVSLENITKVLGQSIASIKLDLTAAGRWGFQGYDNVVLSPVRIEEKENVMPNGDLASVTVNEETGVTSIDGWGNVAEGKVESVEKTDGSGDRYVVIHKGSAVERDFTGGTPGQTYLLEIRYKAAAKSDALLNVHSNSSYDKFYAEETAPANTTADAIATAEWATWRRIVRVNDGKTGFKITLRNHPSGSGAPVYYDDVKLTLLEDFDASNLVLNGDFSYDKLGTEVAMHWSQTNAQRATVKLVSDISSNTTVKTLLAAYGGDDPGDSGEELHASETLVQSIRIYPNNDLYKNQKNYDFKLTFNAFRGANDTYTADGATKTHERRMSVRVIAASGDNNSKTSRNMAAREYICKTDFVFNENTWNSGSIDITPLIEALGGTAVKIDLNIYMDYCTAITDIKLLATQKAAETAKTNLLANGGFETGAEGWTAEGTSAAIVTTAAVSAVEGSSYATIPANASATATIAADKAAAGKAYVLRGLYMQTGADARIEITSVATGKLLLSQKLGEQSSWSIIKKPFMLGTEDTNGVAVKLINGADANNAMFDDLRIYEIAGYAQGDNLVVNGDFEMDSVNGQMDIVGWTNEKLNEGRPAYIKTTNGETRADGTAYAGGKGVEVAVSSGLLQSVSVNDYNSFDGENYNFVLSWDMHYYNGGFQSVWVRVRFADGTSKENTISNIRDTYPFTATYTAQTQYPAELWKWNHHEYDMSHLTKSTTSPIEFIDVRLVGSGASCAYDNIELKVLKNDVSVVDADGAEVTEITTNESAAYSAKPVYYGATEGVTAYLAIYRIGEDGKLRLVKVDSGAVATNGGENAPVTIEGVNAVAGSTVVKAFIWGGDIDPIVSKTID